MLFAFRIHFWAIGRVSGRRLLRPFFAQKGRLFLWGDDLKRFFSLFFAFCLLVSFCFFVSADNSSQKYITSALTPTDSATLKWSKKLGGGFAASPTAPLVVGDTLIVASGKTIYKLNSKTGDVLQSNEMLGSLGYAVVAPTYAENKIFIQLNGGKIQAFDFETLDSLWLYTDALGGQALSPIVCDDGYIYTGFWNGEDDNANFVCLSTKDEQPNKKNEKKKAKWVYRSKGGFYWTEAAVTKGYVIFGTDDGNDGTGAESRIVSLNKKNGKLSSSLRTKGDIRCAVTYDKENGFYFTASKSGFVYRFKFNEETGELRNLKKYKTGGEVTSSPVAHNGRIYFACQNGKSGKFVVVEEKTMKKIYDCQMLGYSQSTPLISVAYKDVVYVYMTYNEKPGGITVFKDSSNQTEAIKTELFEPSGDASQYCICSVTADENGNLFYKNDSGTIFAVGKKSNSLLTKILNILFRAIIRFASGIIS